MNDKNKTKIKSIKESKTLRKERGERAINNITERKKMEEALRNSEKRFRALIESSSDIIQVVDLNGILRYVSPSVQRILGYRPEELVGKPSVMSSLN